MAITNQADDEVLDVIIVGAGPCGLATAARLREHAPAALFTDEEHRRYHWIGKHGSKMALKHVGSGKVSPGGGGGGPGKRRRRRPEYAMAVLDATDDGWLGRWRRLFDTYDISHLRSPMLWHLDPLDRDALLAHAYRNERQAEMVEIRNCVGKEVSKHAKKKHISCKKACGSKQSARVAINLRDRNDYYTPSQALFCDHCDDVVDRYSLGSGTVLKETLRDVDYGVVRGVSIDGESLFTVTSSAGVRYARTVILAVGPANVPTIPDLPSFTKQTPSQALPQACHSMHITSFPDPVVKARIATGQATNILIIGGGLTSAQIADLAIRRGVSKVWLLLRGPCRVKHFDVDLDWMGKYKNAQQARFWTADDDLERLAIIKEARGGGSFTPTFHRRIKKHMAAGRVDMRTETRLVDAAFDTVAGKWSIQTEPHVAGLPAFDYMYFATGIQTDFAKLPYLQTMLRKHPIKGHGGFPCLNEDLMWDNDVPLFMVGRLAALQLGPAAPNIGGAKIGAERVAWAIEDLIKPLGSEDWNQYERQASLEEYLSGHGNMYDALAIE